MEDALNGTDAAVQVLPSQQEIEHARASLLKSLPTTGAGLEQVQEHIRNDIVPGFNRPSKLSTFYGFVTGGATPAATFGDNIVTENDQNVFVHLPKETIATEVEDRALLMVCELLDLTPDDWPHRTFTTGATASNVVGLACGREFVIREAAAFSGNDISVAENGIQEAMRKAGTESIQVLTTVPHSSLRKAASIVGLGRAFVRDVSLLETPHRFDMQALKTALGKAKVASIVAVSCAEVNTGFFATQTGEMEQIRKLCDQYGAWLHVDAAFGLLARALPHTKEYEALVGGVKGFELADSITGDAHKLLNVVGEDRTSPYNFSSLQEYQCLADHPSLTTAAYSSLATLVQAQTLSRTQTPHISTSPKQTTSANDVQYNRLAISALRTPAVYELYQSTLASQPMANKAIEICWNVKSIWLEALQTSSLILRLMSYYPRATLKLPSTLS